MESREQDRREQDRRDGRSMLFITLASAVVIVIVLYLAGAFRPSTK